MSPREGTSWLRCGCFGCLAVVGTLVLIAAVLVGIAALMARTDQVTSRELAPELSPGEVEAPGGGVEAVPPGGAVRVILDLQHAGFEVARGERLRVDARYSESAYELTEKLEDGPVGETLYRVTFRRKGSGLLTGLKELLGGEQPRVRIELPPDRPIALDIDVTRGAMEADLGGLWLTSTRIHGSQGAVQVGFRDPLRAPMERFEVDASMAGVELSGVGNASPADVDVSISMAGAEVDLRGSWSQDARIAIDSRMAGTVVRLPRDVRIVGLDQGEPRIEPDREVPLPTLTFEVSRDTRGELQFVD
jgi:hypothetical protein